MGDLNEWMPRARSIRVLEDFFGYVAPIGRSFPSSLPMFALDRIFVSPRRVLDDFQVHDTPAARTASDHLPVTAVIDTSFISGGASRSEERRVGKEGVSTCRYRWSTYH